MIDRRYELSMTRQLNLLGIGRGSIYYFSWPASEADLTLMEWIDRLHLELPFAGSPMLQGLLKQDSFEVGRWHLATRMRRMEIEALYRWPDTSKPAPGHKIYHYLLRGLVIDGTNQFWAIDITYIPLTRGFIYLAAVIGWLTRQALFLRVLITLEATFYIESIE